MLTLAAYVRVSTQRQVQSQSTDQQIDRLRAYALTQGADLAPEHIFRDEGYSGASLQRPGLDALRDAAASPALIAF
jgi:site-specific DNA recombinase